MKSATPKSKSSVEEPTLTIDLVSPHVLDAVTQRVHALVHRVQTLEKENTEYRHHVDESQAGKEAILASKASELSEKEIMIERQQQLLKDKDSAYQELQHAFQKQRHQMEELNARFRQMEIAAHDQRVEAQRQLAQGLSAADRERMRRQVEGVLEEITSLEKIVLSDHV